jgi:hypothetical protein
MRYLDTYEDSASSLRAHPWTVKSGQANRSVRAAFDLYTASGGMFSHSRAVPGKSVLITPSATIIWPLSAQVIFKLEPRRSQRVGPVAYLLCRCAPHRRKRERHEDAACKLREMAMERPAKAGGARGSGSARQPSLTSLQCNGMACPVVARLQQQSVFALAALGFAGHAPLRSSAAAPRVAVSQSAYGPSGLRASGGLPNRSAAARVRLRSRCARLRRTRSASI